MKATNTRQRLSLFCSVPLLGHARARHRRLQVQNNIHRTGHAHGSQTTTSMTELSHVSFVYRLRAKLTVNAC